MATPENKREEWRRLYETAVRLRQMAPWTWMDETDIFALRCPGSQEPVFVSIMGALGEHLAISVYLGAGALGEFWDQQEDRPVWPGEHIVDIPQLQAMYVDRADLMADERALVKSLGFTFHGRQSWPVFRSYRPGYMPWMLEAAEVSILACALEQALDVCPRVQALPAILQPGDDDAYLLRTQRGDGGREWIDEIITVPAALDLPEETELEEAEVGRLAGLPRRKSELEVDFFPLMFGIQESKDRRPLDPYVLLIADKKTGNVQAPDMMTIETTLHALVRSLPLKLGTQLAKNGWLPQAIVVRAPLLATMLMPLARALRIELTLADDLPAVDDAKISLLEAMAKR